MACSEATAYTANTVPWKTDRSAPDAEAKTAAKVTEGRYSEPSVAKSILIALSPYL
jgi:hypothetical protein